MNKLKCPKCQEAVWLTQFDEFVCPGCIKRYTPQELTELEKLEEKNGC